MNKNILASAITTVILLASGSANAAFTVSTDLSATQNIANQTTPAALSLQVHNATAADPVITVGAATDLPDASELRLVLTSGAKWLKRPAIADSGTAMEITGGAGAGGAGVAADDADILISADESTLTYKITTAPAAADALTIAIKTIAGMFDLSDVADGDEVKLEVQGFNPATGSFSANGVQTKALFAKVDLATFSLKQSSAVADVSASPSFTTFTGGALVTTCTGTTTLKNNTSSQTILSADATFTLQGDFSDVDTITDGAGTGTWTINAAKDEATANLASNLIGAATTGEICPILTFSGDNAIPVSTYKISVETAATSGFIAGIQATDEDLIKITHNGSSFSSNSSGPLNKFKITDLSGAVSSSVAISAVDAAGAEITATGSPALPTTIAGGTTIVVEGADIMSNFPGAQRIDFTIESKEIQVSNVKKTADGTTLTVYTSGADGAI